MSEVKELTIDERVAATEARIAATEATRVSRNRIEITEWRVAFDDEDCLDIRVFGAGDTTSQQDLIAAEQRDNYVDTDDGDDDPGITWGDDDAKHCGMVINTAEITDGEILTSHDGRRWMVTIEEYLGGPEVLADQPHCRACGATEGKPHHDDGDDPIVVRINKRGLCQCCARGQAQLLAQETRHRERGYCTITKHGFMSVKSLELCSGCQTAQKIRAERETLAHA